jgi:hypothetical protein
MQTCENDGLSANNPKKGKKQKTASTDQQSVDARIISNLIKESLNKLAEDSKAKMYKEECAQAVIAVLAEFLQNYILIGYDFEGTNIKIVKANNSLEADALLTALQKFVMQMQFGSNDV